MRKPTGVSLSFLFALAVSNTSCVRPPAVTIHRPRVILINNHVLVSEDTHRKYTIDSAETFIAAVDSFGNVLWKKDPWVDYNIWASFYTKRQAERLDYNREPINIFWLGTLDHDNYREKYGLKKGDEIIHIGDGNMFGFIDTKNGDFHYVGMD